MTLREKIIHLYYDEHSKQNIIAKDLDVSPSYVTKVIKNDSRYNEEKAQRLQQNHEKHKETKRNWIRSKRQSTKNQELDDFVKYQHNQAVSELSYSSSILSDYAYFKWNSSAYHRNSNGNLVLDKHLKVGFDVPKYINMNIKVPTQRYKNIYCFS